jgi:integrase
MPREATGEVRFSGGVWTTRITLREKERETFPLPSCRDEGEARERSRVLSTLAKRCRQANVSEHDTGETLKMAAAATLKSLPTVLRLAEELIGGELEDIGAVKVPTFSEVAKRWTSGELSTLYPDHVKVKDGSHDEKRLAHISSVDIDGRKFGELPINRVTVEYAETVMRALPKAVKRPAARRHYAQVLSRVLLLAVYPLRLISVSPIPKNFLPKIGKPPKYPYLYPDEEAALMACPPETVPLHVRLFYGFLSREGCRASEAAGLRWRDLNLKVGTVKLDESKTGAREPWALDPGVLRALRLWKERSDAGPGDHVFAAAGVPVDTAKLAERLRADLAAAGVDREELFEASSPNARKLRAHDLRATFTTLALARGETERWVTARTGHTTSAMLNRYRRSAETAMELDLGWLRPLDQAIPEFRNSPRIPQESSRPLGGTVYAGDLKSSDRKVVPVRVREGLPL